MSRPLMSPDGCRIRGTLESLRGVARTGDITRNAEGEIQFTHQGGTDVWWEEAKTIERDGQTIFVDEDGQEWAGSELVETPEDEDEENESEPPVPGIGQRDICTRCDLEIEWVGYWHDRGGNKLCPNTIKPHEPLEFGQ